MKKLLILVLAINGFATIAQQEEPIITDRPTQSASAFVVPQGKILLETGFLGEKVTGGITNTTYVNALLRWGLIQGVEVRLTQNYVGYKVLGERTQGFSPFVLGTKIHMMNEDGWKPQMSVIGQLTFKTGEESFRPASTVAEVRLNFQNTLSENVSLGYNLGYVDSGFNEILYSVVLGVGLVDGWSFFVEPYGFFGDDIDQRINAGLIYLAKSNLQFDISFGSGISKIAPDSFLGFGASFSLN
ncbi:MAG: transporter [Cyclobacteriaceae bacterium]